MLIKLGRASRAAAAPIARGTGARARLALLLIWAVVTVTLVGLFAALRHYRPLLPSAPAGVPGSRLARALEMLQSWAAVSSSEAGAVSLVALLDGFALRLAGVIVVAACVASCALIHAPTRAAVRSYFTASGSPIDLAAFRIVFFGYALVLTSKVHALRFAALPPSLQAPLGDPLLPLAQLLQPDVELMRWMLWSCRAACVLALLGLCTRAASCLAAVALFYVLGVPQLFGKVNHYHHVLWIALIFAAAPSGDALSLDALWRERANWRLASLRGPAASRAYALPLRLIWLLVGLVYFFPGLWKVLIGGSQWFLSDSLANHMRHKWYEDPSFTPLFRADQSAWLLTLAGLGTLVFELGFVFVIFSKRYRLLAPASALLFHNLTGALMNIHFVGLQLAQLSFVPWARLLGQTEVDGEAGHESAPPASAPRSSLPSVLVGSAVIALVITYGAMRKVSAWPFACYPTFDSYAPATWRDLLIVGVGETGREVPVPDRALGRRLGPERLTALKQELLRSAATSAREQQLRAYWSLLEDAHAWPSTELPLRIHAYRSELSLVPEQRAARPVSLSLLHTLELPRRP